MSLALGLGLHAAHAQTPLKTIKKGSVSGKITIKGKAASTILVSVRPSDFSSPFETSYRAVTDLQGLYRVTDIPPGSYQVIAVVPAYIATNDNSRGKTVVIGDGENVDGIDFSLIRGGVITGKVTDADGRPVIEQRVSLVQGELSTEQRLQLGPLNSATTDDRGIYRMFGLRAGRYKVSVGQGSEAFFGGIASGRPTYKLTYHPDVNDYSKATIVEVTEGSESTNVDISLGRVAQTFAVNGRVISGENSEPIAGVRFGLRMITGSRGGAFISSPNLSDAKGQFLIEHLTPGKYAVFILPTANSPLRADPIQFEILDRDVNDIVVTTSKGASLTGVVVLENTDNQSIVARLMKLQVQGYVQSETPGGNIGHSSPINGDGSFQLTGLEVGSLYFSLGPFSDAEARKTFNLIRIERDGVVQPRGVEIKKGEQISGVRLVIAYGSGVLRGTVTLQNGTLPAGGRISLRLTKLNEANSALRPPTIDERGHFLIDGLPVGAYEIAAFVFVPGARTATPITKQQITISDESTTEVLLTIDLAQKPEQ